MSLRRLSSVRACTRLSVAVGALGLFLVRPSAARADGAYGRLRGDVGIEAAAGSSFGRGPALGLSTSALYLVSVGPYGAADLALSSDARLPGGGTLRSLSAGVEVRPFFLPRFFTASETGRSFLDLVFDSAGLRLGSRFFPGSAARAFEVGGLVDLPLGLRYGGALLGLSVTKVLSPRALAGQRTAGEDTVFFGVALGLRGMLTTHLVDAGDGLER